MKQKIILAPIESIQKSPINPRVITEAAMAKLMESIKDFPKMLEYRPILVDRKTGNIIGGNQRYEACKRLGFKQVPIAYLDGLDDKQIRELMLKDNLQFGEWDFDKLIEFYDQQELISWGMEDAKYVSFFNDDDQTGGGSQEDPDEAEQENEYTGNVIKKIVFNLENEEYDRTIESLLEFNKQNGFEDNSEALIELIKRHEESN